MEVLMMDKRSEMDSLPQFPIYSKYTPRLVRFLVKSVEREKESRWALQRDVCTIYASCTPPQANRYTLPEIHEASATLPGQFLPPALVL